jgi:hypothetical protein
VRWRGCDERARVARGGIVLEMAAGGEVMEPTYERVRGMLRVRVEVDGGLCVVWCG